jgi:RND family efflux transporter MFP subunit
VPLVTVPLVTVPLAMFLATVFLAGCDTGGAAASGPRDKTEDEQPPLVKVDRLEVREVRREIEASAFLASELEVTVTSKISGRVLEVLVNEGQLVKKGSVLARLEDREAQAAKKQVELQLTDKKLRLDLAEWEVKAAGHRVIRAEIERDQANAEHQRLSKLDPDVVPPKQLEDAKFALDSATEALKETELNAEKAKLDVKVAQQAIKELEARLDETAARLEDHDLRAPMDGVVAKRAIDGGEAISTSIAHTLFLIVDPRNLISYLKRPQRELPLVKHAKTVLFTTDAYPDQEFTGTVDMVSPIVDPTTGSFDIRIRVPEVDTRLLVPGMFIRARILTEESRRAIMVPKTAVLAEGDESIVFVVRDGIATKIVLVTGLEDSTHVESCDQGNGGLQENDLLVVSGHDDLKDRTRVEVVED